MGALHEGHLALMRQAAAENTDVFVSIYVNPAQFGANEDLDSYPRTWDSDLQKLCELNADLARAGACGQITAVFAPTTKVIYPTGRPSSDINGDGTFVTVTPISRLLEGASRPVFFRGVATVCTKLFNIVEADRVYFGQKDIQQTLVIKQMVKDLWLNTEVRVVATAREDDGLAMSSRNVYLGDRRRRVGLVLYKALKAAETAYVSGQRSRAQVLGIAREIVDSVAKEQASLPPSDRALFVVDYISLADPIVLNEIETIDQSVGAVLSGAIKFLPVEDPRPGEGLGLGEGQVVVRLIDNIVLNPIS